MPGRNVGGGSFNAYEAFPGSFSDTARESFALDSEASDDDFEPLFVPPTLGDKPPSRVEQGACCTACLLM